MTTVALTGANILVDQDWFEGHCVLVDGGNILAVVADDCIPSDARREELEGGLLVPGFIDTQVNGGGGVLFNDVPTMDGLRTISEAHRQFGTTAMMPTLISDDYVVIETAISAVAEAMTQKMPGIVGIHIEGPFLNRAKRGIHDAAKFRPLDDRAMSLLTSLPVGRTLITLAPELAPPHAISKLVEQGVIVAAGHSLASYEDMQSAVDEGLSGVTHLFNAMTQLESRAPGVVGAAFDHDIFCGIIVDGHHVHPGALRTALRSCGKDRLMLVTDAMPTVGASTRSFSIGDHLITAHEGALRAVDGTLAGSDLDMASAVRNCVSMMGCDLATACIMASHTPARFLGLKDRGLIKAGYRADLVHLDAEGYVSGTWINGIAA